MRISGIANDSITDGPGLRLTVFAQGCPHRCPGCHNPLTHDPDAGREASESEILNMIDKNPLLDGVTLSGGEPFMQPQAFAALARKIRERRLNIITYSGYTWEELCAMPQARELILASDYIVDGPFILKEKSLELDFAGSRNQRFIDVKKTLETGSVTLKR